MSKPVILTGLRANNDLHIGNYFGALLPIVDMAVSKAGNYQVNLFVPDLHSFTTPINHRELPVHIENNLRLYVAAGLPLDNPDVRMYRQSYIPAHSELTWILDCFTGMGEMGRMTQFKDKSARLSEDRVSLGLFNYPVLMAADILLYDATYVPVGEDQTQHLEFTRDIAERLNNQFGKIFTVPLPVHKQHEFFGADHGLRIRDLQTPTKKMSKSDETGKGVLFLRDDPSVAAKKIMAAATDSVGSVHYDYASQPGVSNLLEIAALLSHRPIVEVAADWEGSPSYGDLKKTVAGLVADFLQAFQEKLNAVSDETIYDKLVKDEAEVNTTAKATLLRAQQAVGLRK